MAKYKGFDGQYYEHPEDEVDEMMKKIPRPFCKVCDNHWHQGALVVCKDCLEYFCDTHIKEHDC